MAVGLCEGGWRCVVCLRQRWDLNGIYTVNHTVKSGTEKELMCNQIVCLQ